MAWAIAMYVRDTASRYQQYGSESAKSVWNNVESTKAGFIPFYPMDTINNPNSMSNGRGGTEDLYWLYR